MKKLFFFVSIKVDREERPDIDNVYMMVAQMISGRGGWPLTIIMTPDKKPFYAATYIPKHSRFGIVGMMDLIPRINVLWKAKKDELLESAYKITKALDSTQVLSRANALKGAQAPKGAQALSSASTLDSTGTFSDGEMLEKSILSSAFEDLKESFDQEHGGFGAAPKFPTPSNLLFLLRYWKRTGDEQALRMVEKTLSAMSSGGINDHVGGGFHRYSTDREPD
jgi:uncharacterized protein YyaL (SSP411 family)